MRFSRAGCWLAMALVVALPAAAFAQMFTSARAGRAIEETERRIELAAMAVSGTDKPRARSELDLAKDLQSRARAASAAGQPSMAGQLSLQARGRVDRASALTRGLPSPVRVRGQVERTREMLSVASDRIQECSDDRARALLRVALEMQDRAENAARAGRLLGALQLTMGARQGGLRALRLCRMEESAQEAARRALLQTDEVLARARELLERGAPGGAVPQQVRDALIRAGELQEEARRQARDERYEASLRLTLTARRLAHRALRRGPGPPG